MPWKDPKKGEEWRKKVGYYTSDKYKALRKKNGWNTYKKWKSKKYKKNPNLILARNLVYRLVKTGKITKADKCEFLRCKESQRLQAHHYLGYAKKNWAKVKWLCHQHHKQQHYV